MKCPHCLEGFHSRPEIVMLNFVKDGKYWRVAYEKCPECLDIIIKLENGERIPNKFVILNSRLVYPKTTSRIPISPDVPEKFAKDYKEASLVIEDSPKASAALSRRCLQNLLRDEVEIKPQNLNKEIQELIDSKQLPTYLVASIDGVRHIGNFAAHPIKSTSSGEIIDVEPGEAEWLLDTLEGLFDFYFVQPNIMKKKWDDLNNKLKDADKPPMK